MKQLIKNRTVHYVIIAAAIAFGVYVYFYASPTGQAVFNYPLGTMTTELKPYPGSQGTEQFRVVFDSYTPGVGNRNLTGWTVNNTAGVVYTFVGVSLSDGDDYTVCAAALGACDDTWDDGQVWSNDTDELILRDADGANISTISYETPNVDEVFTGIVELGVPVFAKNDKVVLCHQDKKGQLTSKAVAVGPFTRAVENDRNGHHQDENDIIPGFYYDVGEGMNYYSGHNWPAQKILLDNNCS